LQESDMDKYPRNILVNKANLVHNFS
jgi:hypothetical protein